MEERRQENKKTCFCLLIARAYVYVCVWQIGKSKKTEIEIDEKQKSDAFCSLSVCACFYFALKLPPSVCVTLARIIIKIITAKFCCQTHTTNTREQKEEENENKKHSCSATCTNCCQIQKWRFTVTNNLLRISSLQTLSVDRFGDAHFRLVVVFHRLSTQTLTLYSSSARLFCVYVRCIDSQRATFRPLFGILGAKKRRSENKAVGTTVSKLVLRGTSLKCTTYMKCYRFFPISSSTLVVYSILSNTNDFMLVYLIACLLAQLVNHLKCLLFFLYLSLCMCLRSFNLDVSDSLYPWIIYKFLYLSVLIRCCVFLLCLDS